MSKEESVLVAWGPVTIIQDGYYLESRSSCCNMLWTLTVNDDDMWECGGLGCTTSVCSTNRLSMFYLSGVVSSAVYESAQYWVAGWLGVDVGVVDVTIS